MILIWILLICWGLWLLIPYLGKWLMRVLQRRVQKQMFRGMGIDPSMFDNAQKSHAYKAEQSRNRRHKARSASRKIIPEGYGEYIKFTVHSITGTEPWLDTSASPVYIKYTESQITDIRWTELK